MSPSSNGSAAGAIFSQLELQRALFDSLAQRILQNQSRLAAIDAGQAVLAPAEPTASPLPAKVVYLSEAMRRSEIRRLLEDSQALAVTATELETDFLLMATSQMTQTRERVAHLVELATRHAALCSPDVLLQIKSSIDHANDEITRILSMTRQISGAADHLREVVQHLLDAAGG